MLQSTRVYMTGHRFFKPLNRCACEIFAALRARLSSSMPSRAFFVPHSLHWPAKFAAASVSVVSGKATPQHFQGPYGSQRAERAVVLKRREGGSLDENSSCNGLAISQPVEFTSRAAGRAIAQHLTVRAVEYAARYAQARCRLEP